LSQSSGEVSDLKGRNGDRSEKGSALSLPVTLVISEEEQLILLDGTTDAAAEGVLIVR
jgi:hypothetical protein